MSQSRALFVWCGPRRDSKVWTKVIFCNSTGEPISLRLYEGENFADRSINHSQRKLMSDYIIEWRAGKHERVMIWESTLQTEEQSRCVITEQPEQKVLRLKFHKILPQFRRARNCCKLEHNISLTPNYRCQSHHAWIQKRTRSLKVTWNCRKFKHTSLKRKTPIVSAALLWNTQPV